jgi:hypothetical protein
MPDCELVTGGHVSVVYVFKFCINTCSSGRLECNFRFVGPEVVMGWTISKKIWPEVRG